MDESILFFSRVSLSKFSRVSLSKFSPKLSLNHGYKGIYIVG